MNNLLDPKTQRISTFTLVLVFIFVVFYYAFIQFLSPVLYEGDSYYHTAIARLIKDFGPHYKFSWAQFSTFTKSFSDKEFLFHVSIIPFLYFNDNIILAAKLAVIFYNILFLLLYIFIVRKYLADFLVACTLLLFIFSFTFSAYFLYLRPTTLANILTMLGVYFLIHKKWIKVFMVSVIFALSHLSFFTLMIFAVVCEIIRYLYKKEFFFKNISFVVIGTLVGCFIHPNYPHNWTSIYLNAILVPIYAVKEVGIDFGGELFSSSSKIIFLDNFALFFSFNILLWLIFLRKVKVSFATLAWWGCTSVYIVFAFFGNRNWYAANVLFFIFFSSCIGDWLREREFKNVSRKIMLFIGGYVIVFILFAFFHYKETARFIRSTINRGVFYENTAYWMRDNIPPGETIYHPFWADSTYFICLNPQDNYLVVLDPIYMFAYSPETYKLYKDLKNGRIDNPYEVINKTFKVKYGFVPERAKKLYDTIKQDKVHFKIIYNDKRGIVFEILKEGKGV